MSHLSGPPGAPPPATSVLGALEAASGSRAPWLVFHRGREARALDFAGAWQLALRWAAALEQAGVEPGTRVAVIEPNDPDFVGAFFGAQALGATPVPLAWPVVAAAGQRNQAALAELVRAADVAAIAAPLGFEPALSFGPRVVNAAAAAPIATPERSHAHHAFIQFTSGSTGWPRGASISHAAAVASAWAMGLALNLGPGDRGVSWLPLFHDMGLVGVMLCSLLFRFPIHLMAPGEFLLRPARWLELLSQERATLTVAPNFGYELAARRAASAKGLDLSALRIALNGSEPVHRATIDAFERTFVHSGLRQGAIRPAYGLAENTLGVAFGDPCAPDLSRDGRRIPSVGTPLPGMEVSLRRPGGALVREGDEGEIAVRGPSLMSSYFRDPEATARALQGGWLHTGDLGVISGGRLYITGREKDLVIKNGQKFHPYDIERVVANAVDSPPGGVAAFAVTNDSAGTEELVVVAELRRASQADGAVRLIRGRLLEELGVRAERIELVGPGALPRTTSGKLRRRACAELYGRPQR